MKKTNKFIALLFLSVSTNCLYINISNSSEIKKVVEEISPDIADHSALAIVPFTPENVPVDGYGSAIW